MKINFNIDYHTMWGEIVYIVGNVPELGNNVIDCAIKMQCDGYRTWSVTIDIATASINCISYKYLVLSDNGSIRHECGMAHKLYMDIVTDGCRLSDIWHDSQTDGPLYTSAFTDGILSRKHNNELKQSHDKGITLCIDAINIAQNEVVAICGDCTALGCWDTDKAVLMSDAHFPTWCATVNVDKPFQYKYVILNAETHELLAWEDGNNRYCNHIDSQQHTVIADLPIRLHRNHWHGAGVAIPVFSLRSNNDCGVGDFADIKLLIDWAAATGQKFIQLLPINDTTMTGTWRDSYPYNLASVFALHPMYLHLPDIGTASDKALNEKIAKAAAELNLLPDVDYERVNAIKNEYTHALYQRYGAQTIRSTEFKQFCIENRDWLEPYAAYCTLRDKFGSADFSTWGEYAIYKQADIVALSKTFIDEFNYIYYLQYHLDKQLLNVRQYAHDKGIAIKGDIPIGVSPTSVDAWMSPQLFNMDSQAGAPPDDFAVLGQNWGFPTYNWEQMNIDGYAWWKARLQKMSQYFDAYRIDHILGFFRIWQIPKPAVHGLLGYFNPALPFSSMEIQTIYGFEFDKTRHTMPYITDSSIDEIFGRYANVVRGSFVSRCEDGTYNLKKEFSSQRLVAKYFADKEATRENKRLCDGLMSMIEDVLFIEAPNQSGYYHPRISAQNTYAYRSLSDKNKWCYNRLYNDFYYYRHNEFWQKQALQKLPPIIDATNMLVCAEDLGMIPSCVPSVLNQLQILSLEIQRMPKAYGVEFGNTSEYPYLSVCTTSTHDMSGIRQWWEEDAERTQHYFNSVLHDNGQAPRTASAAICEQILNQHLSSPSMVAIFPLQDWLSIDASIRRDNPFTEQINIPANPQHYWRYRMHISLESLLDNTRLNEHIKNMIAQSGRL
jgi:4-alpha-glucanotransferase